MQGIISIRIKSVKYVHCQLLGVHLALRTVKHVTLVIPNNLKKILWTMFAYVSKALFGMLFRKNVSHVQVK